MSKVPYCSIYCRDKAKSCLYLENDYYEFVSLFFNSRMFPMSPKRVFQYLGIVASIHSDSNYPFSIFETAASMQEVFKSQRCLLPLILIGAFKLIYLLIRHFAIDLSKGRRLRKSKVFISISCL